MRIKKVFVLVLLSLLLGSGIYLAYFLYVNFGPRSAHFWTVKSIQLDQERIGNLSLNQSINELKPTPIADKNNSLFEYYTLKDGTKIATNFNDDKIIRINVYGSSSFATSKGIQVGDSKEKIFQMYGNNYYNRVEQGCDIIGYVDKKLNRTVEFWLSEDVIISIRLDVGSMD